MSRFMRRYPSPSLIVSIIALVIALGGAGYSATGGNFILGVNNGATTQTGLVSNLNGRALSINNQNAGASATALALIVKPGHPPFVTNSGIKVPGLNADRIDNLDSTQFPTRRVIPYNLAAGANSAPIALPANRPVLLMGADTNLTTTEIRSQAVGLATLLQSPANLHIGWTSLEPYSPEGITAGFSSEPGTHIVFTDSGHLVDVEVNGQNTIRIHNGSTGQRTGIVTLIW